MFNLVMFFDQSDEDPRYSIVPTVGDDAPEDSTVVILDPFDASLHGIDLDSTGFPEASSLEAWHRENNPHLFND